MSFIVQKKIHLSKQKKNSTWLSRKVKQISLTFSIKYKRCYSLCVVLFSKRIYMRMNLSNQHKSCDCSMFAHTIKRYVYTQIYNIWRSSSILLSREFWFVRKCQQNFDLIARTLDVGQSYLGSILFWCCVNIDTLVSYSMI